jgi:hypothetical protein
LSLVWGTADRRGAVGGPDPLRPLRRRHDRALADGGGARPCLRRRLPAGGGEVRRGRLEPGGVAVFVTPNRLTFGPAEEIVDPYHHVEFAAAELRALCETSFGAVEMRGIFGSPRYLELVDAERKALDRVLGLDPLRLRRLLPRGLRQRLYDAALRRRRTGEDPAAAAIEVADFRLEREPLAECLDLVAICRA